MKKKKYIVQEDSNPEILHEPICEYAKVEEAGAIDEYNIPNDLILKAYELAKQSIKAGKIYTTQEVMTKINDFLSLNTLN